MNHSTKTRAQIAAEYGICTRTLRRWLKRERINLSPGLLCPKEQIRIYEALGTPPQVSGDLPQVETVDSTFTAD